jgi:outer membrane receptor protein involved in Fe transport
MFNGGITGQGLTDLLLGRMSSMLQAAPGIVYKRQKYFGLYVQDTWKATSRLTINAGLRWEPYQPPLTCADTRRSSIKRPSIAACTARRTHGSRGPSVSGDPGVPGFKYGNNRWNEWAPRLGLAWDPKGDGRMTVRAAYGIFYELPYAQKSGPVLVNAPYAGGLQLTNASRAASMIRGQVLPAAIRFQSVLSNPLFPLRGTYPVVSENVKDPYVNQWNLSLQKQIGTNWLVTGNYLGTSTIHLWASSDIDPVIVKPEATLHDFRNHLHPMLDSKQLRRAARTVPAGSQSGQYYGVVAQLDDGATANYHGLLLSVQHRRTNGLTVQGNYTWSHCIGDLEEAQLGIPAQYEYPGMRSYYAETAIRTGVTISICRPCTRRRVSEAQCAASADGRLAGVGHRKNLVGKLPDVTSGIDTSLTNALGGDRGESGSTESIS